MNLIINAHVKMVLDVLGVSLAPVFAAYGAHQIDDGFHHCSCDKSFDGHPGAYLRHLTGSVAARAKVSYRDGQWIVDTISNEAHNMEQINKSIARAEVSN